MLIKADLYSIVKDSIPHSRYTISFKPDYSENIVELITKYKNEFGTDKIIDINYDTNSYVIANLSKKTIEIISKESINIDSSFIFNLIL